MINKDYPWKCVDLPHFELKNEKKFSFNFIVFEYEIEKY